MILFMVWKFRTVGEQEIGVLSTRSVGDGLGALDITFESVDCRIKSVFNLDRSEPTEAACQGTHFSRLTSHCMLMKA